MKLPLSVGFLVAASMFGASLAATAAPLERRPVLSLALAQKMAAGCAAAARDKGWRMSVAVMDLGAQPIVFQRFDGAFLGSVDIALQKARFSASFPFTTRFAADISYGKDGQPPALPGFALSPAVVAFAGGLPVMAGGVHVGGVGVSGGTADEDELCAKAALAAVEEDLR